MGRRTGVGITAEGDMLAALGLRYGTQEATDMAIEVQRTLALSAYRSSTIMARERGAFKVYDAETRKEQPLHSPHQGGRPATLCRHGYIRPTQYCLPYHCTDGNHQSDDSDYLRYRACILARIQTSP